MKSNFGKGHTHWCIEIISCGNHRIAAKQRRLPLQSSGLQACPNRSKNNHPTDGYLFAHTSLHVPMIGFVSFFPQNTTQPPRGIYSCKSDCLVLPKSKSFYKKPAKTSCFWAKKWPKPHVGAGSAQNRSHNLDSACLKTPITTF